MLSSCTKREILALSGWILSTCCLAIVRGQEGTAVSSLVRLDSTRHGDTDTWTKANAWFFSAILNSETSTVDVLGDFSPELVRNTTAGSCRVSWTSQRGKRHSSKLSLTLHHLEYDSWHLSCHKDNFRIPTGANQRVAVQLGGLQLQPRRLDVPVPRTGRAAVCVGPIFASQPFIDFVSFVNYYKDLGFDHVYAYRTEDANVDLEYDGSFVTFFTYQVGSLTWYHGQVLVQHDCIYRLRSAYEYVAYVDLDEYLTLRQGHTLDQFLDHHMAESDGHPVAGLVINTWDYPGTCRLNEHSVLSVLNGGIADLSVQLDFPDKLTSPIWRVVTKSVASCTTDGRFKSIVRPHLVSHRNQHTPTETTNNSIVKHVPCTEAYFKHFRFLTGFQPVKHGGAPPFCHELQ